MLHVFSASTFSNNIWLFCVLSLPDSFNCGFSLYNISYHFTRLHCSGVRGASCSGQRWWAIEIFQLIFTDQPIHFAELRTIIFASQYIPPLDYWPFEPPVHGPLHLDLYYFSIACISVCHPCVTFRTVDTPNLAQRSTCTWIFQTSFFDDSSDVDSATVGSWANSRGSCTCATGEQ